MAQHGFSQFGSGHNGGNIDPNDLTMSGSYSTSYQNNFNNSSNNGNNHNSNSNNNNGNLANPSNGFSGGGAVFGDDELLDGLTSPSEQPNMHGGQDFSGLNDMNSMGFPHGMYSNSHHGNSGMPIDQSHINGYSNTPDGDPIQSPFVHNNFNQYRQMHPQSFGTSIQSPISYSGSPLTGSDDVARARMSQAMQRKASNTRSPLTPKTTSAMGALSMNSQDSSFGAQPIRTGGSHHEKSHSGQWVHTPNSLTSFPGSGFPSPMQPGIHNAQINEMLLKGGGGGASMPAKLGQGPNPAVTAQDMKKKRRRESHNLVERRRRDNINERIQDLSKLVPSHRLEDEKIRKLIQNGTPISPTLQGISNPSQATSGLAGPGARRAANGATGNITTGLPLEDKDKGPNKGDILNGAVSWTRDLMWMLHLKIQQHEELLNTILDLGGQSPFEVTDDERRMQTELLEAVGRNEEGSFSYTRTAGTGLRVPHHTDYKGETLSNTGSSSEPMAGAISISPDDQTHAVLGSDLVEPTEFWNDLDDDGSGDINFKEEDEYTMDLN